MEEVNRPRLDRESLLEVIKGSLVNLFFVLYYWVVSIFKALLPASIQGKNVSGETVLVTGAGSGIGRLMSLRFAQLGCRLVLWDVNKAGNEETAAQCRKFGATARCYEINLCNREDIYKVADQVKKDVGQVDILINNAGIVTGKKFLQCSDSMIQKTMEVNIMAHFWNKIPEVPEYLKMQFYMMTLLDVPGKIAWTAKAFLPGMIERNHGHLVNIASSAGLSGVTGLADYCASKFAAVGFDESLRYELMAQGKTGVHTTVVCPYFINTGMFEGAKTRFPFLLPIMEPEDVANRIVDAVLCNREMIILPRILYFFFALKGFLPARVGYQVLDMLGAQNLMDEFKGRQVKKD